MGIKEEAGKLTLQGKRLQSGFSGGYPGSQHRYEGNGEGYQQKIARQHFNRVIVYDKRIATQFNGLEIQLYLANNGCQQYSGQSPNSCQ